jgi:hypothetical protein
MVDRLELSPKPPNLAPEASLEVVARDTSERVELTANREALDRVAAATGGTVVADYEADKVLGHVHAIRKETVRTEETPLWNQPASLLAFFMVLTLEWVARKRVGLP